MAVSGEALSNHRAIEDVERREQRRGAVALVVVGHGAGPPPLHRQARLGAVQGLDLALLVHAQQHCLVRRVQVEPDHVDELLLEAWIIRELEGLHQVWLQASRPPDPLHGGRTDPLGLGHRPTAPVGFSGRRVLQRGLHDRLDFLRRNRRLASSAFTHLPQLRQPFLGKPLPPRHHAARRHPKPCRYCGVGDALRGQQQRFRSDHLPVRCSARPRQALQNFLLAAGQCQGGGGRSHISSLSQTTSICETLH